MRGGRCDHVQVGLNLAGRVHMWRGVYSLCTLEKRKVTGLDSGLWSVDYECFPRAVKLDLL